MRDNAREFIVGIVFFALVGALGVLTLVLGADAFHRTEEVTFRFQEVAGLAKGADVWINGLPSGQVKSIAIAPDGTVEATALMRTNLAEMDLRSGAKVAVKSKSALGGAIISFDTRQEGGKTSLGEILGTTWKAKKESFEAVGDKISEVSGDLQGLLKDAREGTGLLAKLIKDPKVAEDFTKMLSNFRAVSDDIAAGKGTLGRLARDESLYNRLDAAVASLERFTEDARAGKGALGMLLNDEAFRKRLDGVVTNLDGMVADARAGKGTIGKLLADDSLFRNLDAAVTDLGTFTKQVNEGNGLLHQLAYDKQTGDDFRGTMNDLKVILGDVRAGKGTVGKLMTDEALYQDLRDATRSLQRSFEEARENAPILTFAGFLFKTF